MSTILILGAGGFLAGHIAAHYRQEGWRVVGVGRLNGNPAPHAEATHDWTLPHAGLAALLEREAPEIVVNAAGSSSVPRSIADPATDFENNVALTFAVLDAMRQFAPRAVFVLISSAAVYGDPTRLPVRETDVIHPISPYGWHKHLAETLVLEHFAQHGLRGCSLRIFSAYGPGLRRQVVFDLVERVLRTPDKPLMLQGRPEDSRDFIHAADVAGALTAIVKRGRLQGEAYNLAAGVETPIAALAATIQRLARATPNILFDERPRPGNPSRWHADVERLADLGFSPKVALEDGLAAMIESVRALHVEP